MWHIQEFLTKYKYPEYIENRALIGSTAEGILVRGPSTLLPHFPPLLSLYPSSYRVLST